MAYTLVSGVKNGTSPVFGGFAWQVNSQDVVNNTSNITIMMYGGRTSSTTLNNLYTETSYIEYDGGNRKNISTRYNFGNATNGVYYYVGVDTTVFPMGDVYTFTVTHNADGTRSVPIKTYFNGNNGTYLVDITTTGTIVLPTIARASQPTLSASSIPFEQAVTVYTNKAAGSSFTHNISYSFGSASGSIGTGVVDSVSWTPARALAAQIPSSNSGTGTIICDTYNGATLIGTKTIGFTLTVPSTYRAALTASHTGFALSTPTLTTYAIQNITTLSLTLSASLTDLVSTYGTTIVSYQMWFNTYNSGEVAYSGSAINVSAGIIPVSGTRYAYYKVKDARGNWSNEISEQIMGTGSTIYPYAAPANTGFNVARTATIGQANFEMSFSRSPVGGANKWWYQRQYYDGATWQPIDATNMPNDLVGITTDTLTSILSHSLPYVEANVYRLRVKLTDSFNTVYYEDTLPTASVPFALTATGAGIGKIPTNTTYDLEVGARGISSDGVISGSDFATTGSLYNSTASNYALVNPSTTGTIIQRNTGDANTALRINQHHSSSTGLITDFQFGGVSKASINKDGKLSTASTSLVTNLNSDLLDSQHGSYYAPTVYYGRGLLFGSTTAGITYTGYGHVRCVKHGNVYTFKGEGRVAVATGLTATFNTGLSITNIKSLCGITATLALVSSDANFLTVIKAAGTSYASNDAQYVYGLSLASNDGGQTLHCGRYYDNAASFGGWDATTAFYAVNNIWQFEFVMITA